MVGVAGHRTRDASFARDTAHRYPLLSSLRHDAGLLEPPTLLTQALHRPRRLPSFRRQSPRGVLVDLRCGSQRLPLRRAPLEPSHGRLHSVQVLVAAVHVVRDVVLGERAPKVLGAAPHGGERDATDVDGRQADELAGPFRADHGAIRRAPVFPAVAGTDGERARHDAPLRDAVPLGARDSVRRGFQEIGGL